MIDRQLAKKLEGLPVTLHAAETKERSDSSGGDAEIQGSIESQPAPVQSQCKDLAAASFGSFCIKIISAADDVLMKRKADTDTAKVKRSAG